MQAPHFASRTRRATNAGVVCATLSIRGNTESIASQSMNSKQLFENCPAYDAPEATKDARANGVLKPGGLGKPGGNNGNNGTSAAWRLAESRAQ